MRSVAQRTAISCLVLTFGAAAPLMAQACLGYPTERGQFALNPGITFAENTTTFGAALNANLADPLAFDANVGITSYDGIDSNGVDFSGRVAFELENMPDLSVCPFAGLGYGRVSEDGVTRSGVQIPVGVGVGKVFPASEEYDFSLSGAPQLLYGRASVSGDAINDDTDSNFDFGLLLTATLGTDRFYGGFSLGLTTVENNGTIFRIGAGIPFGI